MKNIFQIITIFITIYSVSYCLKSPVFPPGIIKHSRTIGDCQTCKIFIESFKKGLERTSRGKYEGGESDAAWDEEKLKKSYKRSEVRLIDIRERICKDEIKYSLQCFQLAEKAEDFIEGWWAQDPNQSDDLFTYICINTMKLCCPKHHYGITCTPCPGDHSNLCNGNGKCRGDGTRKGNGTCLCDEGYLGENCDRCALGYYLSNIEKKVKCEKCHYSCMSGCRSGTAKDCAVCKPGFINDVEEGCLDINECNDVNQCEKNQFCLNSIGSFKCFNCHESCIGCVGDGPDMCRKCAQGYKKKDGFCVLISDDKTEVLTTTRYITYVGLLVATGILFPKSTQIGSVIGAMVLTYIVGAEYYCMINGHAGLVDLKEYDLFQLFVL